MRLLRRATTVGALGVQAPVAFAGLYGLGLVRAAAAGVDAPPPADPQLRFVVLVPAHDEEETLPPTLRSLQAMDYPQELFRVVVIADNCSDDTAGVARRAGVDVLERHDPALRGKGYALAWAFDRLEPDADVIVIVDADCELEPIALRILNRHFLAGARAVQVDYRVANPDATSGTELRNAAFLLHNTLRGLGRARLGLSAGMVGTGMAFSSALLAEQPWQAFGVSEDREQHVAWVMGGERVVFVPECKVLSAMPTRDDVARTQQLRWETDRVRLAAKHVPMLVAAAVKRRDPIPLEVAAEALVPPQAAVALLGLTGIGLGVLSDRRRLLVTSGGAAVGIQAVYVLYGLRVAGSPIGLRRLLVQLPRTLIGRAGGLVAAALGRGSGEWVRTERG